MNQYSEQIFENKYDNEFIGLLNEIGIRLSKFSRSDVMKIKSWIDVFMVPVDAQESKKNRNLHAIKLINQMISGRLEEPFTKFAKNIHDMKYLSPIEVRAELTKKFFSEIDFQKIEDFGYSQQKNFLKLHPEVLEHKLNTEENKVYNKTMKSKNHNSNIVISESFDNRKSEKSPKFYNKLEENVDDIKNYIFDYNMQISKIKPNIAKFDRFKLQSIIVELSKKLNERDEIIDFQARQIEHLKKEIAILEKKTRIININQMNQINQLQNNEDYKNE